MSAKEKAGNYKSVFIVVMCLLIIGAGAGLYALYSSDAEPKAKPEPSALNVPERSQPIATVIELKPSASAGEETQPPAPVFSFIRPGVSIENMDVSGLGRDAAENLLKQNETTLLKNIKISFAVLNKQFDYAAADLGISLDAQATVEQAFKVSNPGENIKLGALYQMDGQTARARLTADAAKLNTPAVDATVKFNPKEKEIFTYTPEAAGLNVQTEDLLSMIEAQAHQGAFKLLEAPVEIVPPAVALETLKANTVPIIYSFNSDKKAWQAGFTSYYKKSNESSSNRVYNIAKLAGILNGTVIQPGETFSLNKKAGPRTVERGWKVAHGIVDGRYEDQPGGGVCQVSGTLYNAAIRAELAIVERYHHSWPSTYLPKGLDATISTGGPDLKIKNPYDAPVYIMAAADTKAKSLKIVIYGKPLAHGQYIDFTSKKVASIPQPKEKIIKASKDLEGNPLKPGESVIYPGRTGQKWVVYKQWKDANGKVVKTEEFNRDTYSAFAQRTVVNSK